MRESDYIRGKRAVYREMLGAALVGLRVGDDAAEARHNAYLLERLDALAVLSRICETLGVEFSSDRHLADMLDDVETAMLDRD